MMHPISEGIRGILSVSEVLSTSVHSPQHYAQPPVEGALTGQKFMSIPTNQAFVTVRCNGECRIPGY